MRCRGSSLRNAGESKVARLPDLEPADAQPDIAKAMRAQADTFGYVFNSTKMMGYCPDIAKGSTRLGQAIDEAGHIEPALRYLLYVRVAGLNGCPF